MAIDNDMDDLDTVRFNYQQCVTKAFRKIVIVMLCCAILALSPLLANPLANTKKDLILHTYYTFELSNKDQLLDRIDHSKDVVLGSPLNIEFKERGKVAIAYSKNKDASFNLSVTFSERISKEHNTYAPPVNYNYTLQLDEQIGFTVFTQFGYIITAKIKLTEVERIKVADYIYIRKFSFTYFLYLLFQKRHTQHRKAKEPCPIISNTGRLLLPMLTPSHKLC